MNLLDSSLSLLLLSPLSNNRKAAAACFVGQYSCHFSCFIGLVTCLSNYVISQDWIPTRPRTIVLITTTVFTHSLRHGMHTLTAMPTSTRPSTLLAIVKRISVLVLSNYTTLQWWVWTAAAFRQNHSPANWFDGCCVVLSLTSSHEPCEHMTWRKHYFITSAKEDIYSSLFVCLCVCLLATSWKNFRTVSRKVGNEPMNKWLNFGGDLDRDTGKMYLDGGMHCPSACSLVVISVIIFRYQHRTDGIKRATPLPSGSRTRGEPEGKQAHTVHLEKWPLNGSIIILWGPPTQSCKHWQW